MNTPRLYRILISLLPLLLVACTSITHPAATERKERAQKAQALFQERCKTAGEKIYRTADNVEGVLLMKLRPSEINYGDQYRLDDPYGRDLGGEGYLETFVSGRFPELRRYGTASPPPNSPPRLGYLYVEAIDPKDGKRYRYTGRIEEPWQTDKHYLKGYTRFVLDKTPAPGSAPRYGVTYDDISTREDRDYWIAGSSLRVIDLQTNEVMAERIGYMMDPGQGDHGGGRSPWLIAADYACPSFGGRPGAAAQRYQALDFVEKTLKPKLKN